MLYEVITDRFGFRDGRDIEHGQAKLAELAVAPRQRSGQEQLALLFEPNHEVEVDGQKLRGIEALAWSRQNGNHSYNFV